jgi:peroxiredoxin
MDSVDGKAYQSKRWATLVLATMCLAAIIAFGWPAGQAQDGAETSGQGSPQSTPGAAQPSAPGYGGQAQGRGRGRGRGIQAEDPDHPVLKIGAPAPDFNLTGVDGKTHSLSEYSNAKILAVVFESNHCPVSISYEGRIRQIYEDYKDKGVQLIAINPNNASAIRLNELGYTDSTDSLPEMKIRATLRHIDWPYLYDGETQTTAAKFGAVATPHIFIFDQDRKLRYEGHIDDSTDIRKVTANDARNAIEAILAGQPVPVATTRAFGCSTKWLSKSTGVNEETEAINKEPVNLTQASTDDIKKLRANSTGKTVIVDFWSVKCQDCTQVFHDFENTYRMYRRRPFDMITVSTDKLSEQPQVIDFLQQQHASGTNLQFDAKDAKALEAAVGEKWKLGTPFVMVIGPDGSVLYRQNGKIDVLEVRRHVLASIPDSGSYAGVQAYWESVVSGQ